MTVEQAKEYIRTHATDYLQADKKGTGYVCPICKSGTGEHGTGITTQDGIHFTCFAQKGKDCPKNSDIIDIIGKQNNIDDNDFMAKLRQACKLFNITLEEDKPHKEAKQVQEQQKIDYTEYFKQCSKDVNKTNYWAIRGINNNTIERFNLGYDAKNNTVVIPINKNAYKSRRTDIKQFYNSKGAAMELYNPGAINKDVIYICESEIDALSIEELNKPAIAIRGTSNTELLKELVAKHKNKILLLCLDVDGAGDTATEKILNDMEQAGVPCYDIRPLFAKYKTSSGDPVKDINDMLVYNRDELNNLLQLNVNDVIGKIKEYKRQQYIDENSNTKYIAELVKDIENGEYIPAIKTGYNNLDNYLDGGLYEGLYTIGAITSLGKTTFILQMADYIAEHGTDVLIFSLEMSRKELFTKSVARSTYEYCIKNNLNVKQFAKSPRNITNAALYKFYSADEKEVIKQAIKKYKGYSNNIFIYENDYIKYDHTLSIADVENITEEHKQATGNTPVIIIDYLQLLAPPQERLTDKQAVDQTILRLKGLSRTYNTPVIAISSFNRANYKTPATFESFKESGGIEYTSNVTMALQLAGVEDSNNFNVDVAKSQSPRIIELKILKNRAGKTGGKLQYNYYPQFDYFREIEE